MRSCKDEDVELQARLRAALSEAMRGRDGLAVPALRSVLGAIGDAEAVAAVIEAEIGERLAAARGYEASGHPDWAQQLRREVSVITSALSDGATVPDRA